MRHIGAFPPNGVAASLCRGAPALLSTPRRRHSAVATTLRIHAMFFLLPLFVIAIQGLCCADVTRLATEDHRALQDASRFHEVHSAGDLPALIVALCVGDKRKLANPGENWNATDAITDPTLPGKRLIWAAVGGEYYVDHYERGGIAHTFHVLVAKLTKSNARPKVVWSAVGGPFKGLRGVS